MKTAPRLRTRDLTAIAVFAALTAVCAWITIPAAVPFTMQTFAVFLAMGVLGGKRGTLVVVVYLLLAAVGAPVLHAFQGGLGALVGATGGYLLGFLLLGLVVWGLEGPLGGRRWGLHISLLLGLLVCYAFGTAWYVFGYLRSNGEMSVGTALGICVGPFVVPDLVKLGLAGALAGRLRRQLER